VVVDGGNVVVEEVGVVPVDPPPTTAVVVVLGGPVVLVVLGGAVDELVEVDVLTVVVGEVAVEPAAVAEVVVLEELGGVLVAVVVPVAGNVMTVDTDPGAAATDTLTTDPDGCAEPPAGCWAPTAPTDTGRWGSGSARTRKPLAWSAEVACGSDWPTTLGTMAVAAFGMMTTEGDFAPGSSTNTPTTVPTAKTAPRPTKAITSLRDGRRARQRGPEEPGEGNARAGSSTGTVAGSEWGFPSRSVTSTRSAACFTPGARSTSAASAASSRARTSFGCS